MLRESLLIETPLSAKAILGRCCMNHNTLTIVLKLYKKT